MIIVGGRSILAGTMTLGDFFMYIFFTGLVAAPRRPDRVHRHAGQRSVRRPRSHPRNPTMATEDDEDARASQSAPIEGEMVFDE